MATFSEMLYPVKIGESVDFYRLKHWVPSGKQSKEKVYNAIAHAQGEAAKRGEVWHGETTKQTQRRLKKAPHPRRYAPHYLKAKGD